MGLWANIVKFPYAWLLSVTNLIGKFAMNYPRYIIIIQDLKQFIVSFCIDIKFFCGNFGPSVLITSCTLKGLVIAFATRLPKDCKSTIILTFYMRKLRPSNLDEVLIPSIMYTSVDSKKEANEMISKRMFKLKTRVQGFDINWEYT